MQETKVILSSVAFFINAIIGILFVGALLIFLWGVIRSLSKKKDPGIRIRAKDLMTRGALGAVTMAATWGIVTILLRIFDITAALP